MAVALLVSACAPRPRLLGFEILPEVEATANDPRVSRAQNSPQLARDPTDDRFVALANRWDAPEYNCALQVSADGGRSWSVVNPVVSLPDDIDSCFAPEVAFDRRGILYYLFAGLREPGNLAAGAFLTTSSDRGASFGPARQVLGPFNFGVRMAIETSGDGADRLHLVWLAAGDHPPLAGMPQPPNPILAAHSDDGGQSFSPPAQVSDPARARVAAPTVALGANGAVHVAYHDLGDDDRDYRGLEGPTWTGAWSVVLSSSKDGGQTFSRGVVVDDEVAPAERVLLIFTMPPVALAADSEGKVHVAWTDARRGDWDVFLATSPDGGVTWSAPRRLNDDAEGNGQHQYLPQLACAADGRLDAIFFDRQDSPEDDLHHVTFTYSGDGGRTFSPSVALTTEPSDSRIGQRYLFPSAQGQADLGSRLALLSGASGLLAAWTDSRDARTGRAQDIWVTEVKLRPESG